MTGECKYTREPLLEYKNEEKCIKIASPPMNHKTQRRPLKSKVTAKKVKEKYHKTKIIQADNARCCCCTQLRSRRNILLVLFLKERAMAWLRNKKKQ